MFRVTVFSKSFDEAVGSAAPAEIEAEFRRRTWHRNPRASWDGSTLRLTVENDFDVDGAATLDEFADSLQICLDCDGDLEFDIESVEKL
jgi:hypothetical protein